MTGGRVPYGYKNVNKKAVIDEERAEIVRYIFSQYAAGVFVRDIIASLTSRGILYYSKPFCRATVYKLLKNERYSGVYHYNGEAFTNIYPPIIPKEIYEKVRKKIESNRYGKLSTETIYLLRHKIKCGYCGQSVNAECGTAHNGERKYYFGMNCTFRSRYVKEESFVNLQLRLKWWFDPPNLLFRVAMVA